jgi:divalent metal cation (Fe/Co/Zn/Cd) transporter
VKLPKIGVNFYKVVVGVAFSLLWARVMYLLWPQPSYITFMWFYLAIGSVLLKWVLFEIIDRIHLKIRLRAMMRELNESKRRVREATKGKSQEDNQR